MKIKTALLSLSILILISGCVFDSKEKTIIGPYKLGWIDLPETQSIYVEVRSSGSGPTLVDEYIFEVGYNEDYIIAKQHPTSGLDDGNKINTSIIHYYIIDIREDFDPTNEKVLGPLTKSEFDKKREALGISEIPFDLK